MSEGKDCQIHQSMKFNTRNFRKRDEAPIHWSTANNEETNEEKVRFLAVFFNILL